MLPDARRAAQSGFTLVELLISILLTSIIMLAIYSVYRVQTHSAKLQQNRLDAQESARSVVDIMVREMRNAGYNPLGVNLSTSCGGGVPGAPQILSASTTSIQFTYDFENTAGTVTTPDGNCDGPDENIIYAYDATGCSQYGNITRNGSGNPLTICNVTNFSLRYFRQDGSEITSNNPVSALELPNIQRVQISVTVKSLNPDSEFGGQLTATVTSNVDLRNRGLPS